MMITNLLKIQIEHKYQYGFRVDELDIQKSANIPQPQIRLGYDKSIMD